MLIIDLKRLYYMAGVENKPTVFMFTDTQVLEETFLEDINNILSSGEVPNLYKPDEFEEVNISFFRHMGCLCCGLVGEGGGGGFYSHLFSFCVNYPPRYVT